MLQFYKLFVNQTSSPCCCFVFYYISKCFSPNNMSHMPFLFALICYKLFYIFSLLFFCCVLIVFFFITWHFLIICLCLLVFISFLSGRFSLALGVYLSLTYILYWLIDFPKLSSFWLLFLFPPVSFSLSFSGHRQ